MKDDLYDSSRKKAIAYFDEKDVRDKKEKEKEKKKKYQKATISFFIYLVIIASMYVVFTRSSSMF